MKPLVTRRAWFRSRLRNESDISVLDETSRTGLPIVVGYVSKWSCRTCTFTHIPRILNIETNNSPKHGNLKVFFFSFCASIMRDIIVLVLLLLHRTRRVITQGAATTEYVSIFSVIARTPAFYSNIVVTPPSAFKKLRSFYQSRNW